MRDLASLLNYNCLEILKAAWWTPMGDPANPDTKWGLTINFIGDIGSAKTSMMQAAAREVGLPMQPVSLALCTDAGEIGGIPVPNEDRTRFTYLAPPLAGWVQDTGECVVYYDELNYAAREVQAAAQRVIFDHMMGNEYLGPRVRFVITTNPTDQAASSGGRDIAMALANRMGHLVWQAPTPENWAEWLCEADYVSGANADKMAIASKEDIVLRGWPEAYAHATAAVAQYIKSNPGKLQVVPDPGSPTASGAYPTMRTWEMATRAFASARVHKLDEASTVAFVGCFVGLDTASEFCHWEDAQDIPSSVDILDGKIEFDYDDTRLDRTLVVTNSCLVLLRGTQDPVKRRARGTKFAEMLLCLRNAGAPKDLYMGPFAVAFGRDRTIPQDVHRDPRMTEVFMLEGAAYMDAIQRLGG